MKERERERMRMKERIREREGERENETHVLHLLIKYKKLKPHKYSEFPVLG